MLLEMEITMSDGETVGDTVVGESVGADVVVAASWRRVLAQRCI
jgi:hypothetical protein